MHYLVLGVDTNVGKTFFVESFCRKNSNYKAIKPIISGFDDHDLNGDCAKILAATGLKNSEENLDSISPWRFKTAASPHIAAKKEDKEIDFAALKDFCLKKIKSHPQLLIEGAGGVMTPINYDKTFLDLAAQLNIEVLLVTANYLGSISQTLCAIGALQSKKIPIAAILVNEFSYQKNDSLISVDELVVTLQSFCNSKVINLQQFLEKVS